MEGEKFIELELNTNELVDATLGTNFVQDFVFNVGLHSVDVNDVGPPIMKLSDAKRHASLLSSFLLENSLNFGVNEMIGFQKLIRNLGKMTVTNLGRQHQRTLNSYFNKLN